MSQLLTEMYIYLGGFFAFQPGPILVYLTQDPTTEDMVSGLGGLRTRLSLHRRYSSMTGLVVISLSTMDNCSTNTVYNLVSVGEAIQKEKNTWQTWANRLKEKPYGKNNTS